jgi:hypothetical protein
MYIFFEVRYTRATWLSLNLYLHALFLTPYKNYFNLSSMEKLFDFKNKLELWRWYRLDSLQTVIQYLVAYLIIIINLYFGNPKTQQTCVFTWFYLLFLKYTIYYIYNINVQFKIIYTHARKTKNSQTDTYLQKNA